MMGLVTAPATALHRLIINGTLVAGMVGKVGLLSSQTLILPVVCMMHRKCLIPITLITSLGSVVTMTRVEKTVINLGLSTCHEIEVLFGPAPMRLSDWKVCLVGVTIARHARGLWATKCFYPWQTG